MKRFIVFAVLSANVLLINGCSSQPQVQNSSVEKVSVNSNRQGNTQITNQTNSNTNLNGTVVAPQEVDPQTANTASNSPINANRGKIMNSNSNEKPKTTLVPAPHNSSVGTMMGSKGEFIQLRIFNSDKDIQKMEQDVAAKKTKVFLKNGKIMEIPAGKNIDFINSSPQEILIALGLMNPPDASQTGGK